MRGSIGVHAAHCCKWHGCKYGDPDCPVASGEVEQEYQCEDCWHILKDEGYYRRMVQDIDEIKAWWENKKKNGN
jgi:hypothetical protein